MSDYGFEGGPAGALGVYNLLKEQRCLGLIQYWERCA